jgi:hypothetical protein
VPTRKQRRRQAKERRHEYEYVFVDEEGNEVEVESEEDAPADKPRATKTGPTSAKKPQSRSRQPAAARGGRKIDPPSWQRVFRRAAIFAPVMLVVIYLLDKNAGAPAILLQLVVLLGLFLPFSYYMDTIMYRQYRKRIGDPLPPRERKPRAR